MGDRVCIHLKRYELLWALANKFLEIVVDIYDVPSKMITLAGFMNFNSRNAVKAASQNFVRT